MIYWILTLQLMAPLNQFNNNIAAIILEVIIMIINDKIGYLYALMHN